MTLISLGPSHYCELARWVLDLSGISYQEKFYAPGKHVKAIRRHGGRSTVPLLYSQEGQFIDSGQIIDFALSHTDQGKSLLPQDSLKSSQCMQLLEGFREEMAPAVRILIYDLLIKDPAIMYRLLSINLTWSDRLVIRLIVSKIINILKNSLPINDETVKQSIVIVEQQFSKIEDLLSNSDGPYILGHSLTIADIGFVALASPLVWPQTYGTPLPAFNMLPLRAQDAITGYRHHAAGRYIQEIYKQHRGH